MNFVENRDQALTRTNNPVVLTKPLFVSETLDMYARDIFSHSISDGH